MISHDQHTCDHHHHSHHHHHHLVEAEVIPVSNLTIQDLHLCILIIWWRRTLELWWEEIGNMMRRHGKYIWTPNSETSPHHQSFPFVFIIIVSIIIVGIIVGIIIDDIIIVIDRPHHYNWTGQIPDPLKARSCAGWGRGWLLLIEEQTWANIVLPLLYIFLQLKNFLCRHDHVHWHLIIAIVVTEMMISIEQPPAYLLVQLEALQSCRRDCLQGKSRGAAIIRSRRQRRPLARSRWWSSSASPWWQAPSSSSCRRRGPWSCEVSPRAAARITSPKGPLPRVVSL